MDSENNTLSILKVQSVWLWFFIGYAFLAIAPWVFPVITTAMDDSTVAGVFEVGIILIAILLMIIMPLIKASTILFAPPNHQRNPSVEITISVLIIIFGLLLTFFGYFMLEALATGIEGTFNTTLYWIGLILTWAISIIVAPIHTIIKVSQ